MSAPLFGDDVIFQQRFLKSAGLYSGEIDGIWGPLTDDASSTFFAHSEELAAEHGRFDPRTERNLATLQLLTQVYARGFMNAVLTGGFDVRIISGTRSYAEQNVLFKQGRFGNAGPRVTNARGGQSRHNFGIAWDIGIFDDGAYVTELEPYNRVAEIGLREELEWGGHWVSFQDRPHYQLALELNTSEIRARFEAGEAYF